FVATFSLAVELIRLIPLSKQLVCLEACKKLHQLGVMMKWLDLPGEFVPSLIDEAVSRASLWCSLPRGVFRMLKAGTHASL
ncbi:hypothetical protein C5167_029941, partial [Papaver somniferum]